MYVKTLIITVLSESEAKAVKSVFGLEQQVDEGERYPVYYYPYNEPGQEYIAVSCIVNKGNANAAIATDYLLERYAPKNAILIGTCAGRPDKTRIGDVVTSHLGVYDYGQSFLTPEAEVRLEGIKASGTLTKKFAFLKSDSNLKKKWWPMILENKLNLGIDNPGEIKMELFDKAIASGTQIINEVSMNILTNANNNIYAADQDTVGFALSCNEKKVDWIAVRGVSDCGDRDTRKGNAVLATISAATLVKVFLDNRLEEIAELKSAQRKRNIEQNMKDDAAELFGKLHDMLGCSQIWVPYKGSERHANEERNQKKIKAIKNSSGSTIRLMAQTGYSYLCNRGVFFDVVYQHLQTGGTFNIVLADPSTENITLTKQERNNINAKYKLALSGYVNLSREFEDQIYMKMVPINLSATIFIANTLCFYEPYIHYSTEEREKFLFVTFEMLFDKEIAAHGYDLMLHYFKRLYQAGDEYQPKERR